MRGGPMPSMAMTCHRVTKLSHRLEGQAMDRQIRKLKSRGLSLNERALVTETGDADPDVYLVQHDCEIVDLSPLQLKLVTSDPIPVGQRLEIIVRLAGAYDACHVSGTVRAVASCCAGKKFLLAVDVASDALAEHWRNQFN